MTELSDLEAGSNRFTSSLRSMTSSFLPNREEDPLADTLCPQLSYKQRIYGWLACFLLGCFISLLSFRQFLHDLSRFAMLYSFGNLVGLCSSFFLCGPRAQFRSMKDPKRVTTSVLYVLSMVLTLVAAVWVRKDANGEVLNKPLKRLLILILVITQWCCLTWYCISYIPYGRSMARSCMKKICCDLL